MVFLRLAAYILGSLTLVVALVKDAPFATFGGALSAMFAVFFLQAFLPRPTEPWSSRSGAVRFSARPAPDWSVAVRGLACLAALVYEAHLLRAAWGAS